MERGSDKHGPRLDEQLEHDVRSMLQGQPVESRASEAREQEGPGDDDPVPDMRLAGERGFDEPGARLRDAEIEERSDLARRIQGAVFPADRRALIASAEAMQAPPGLIDRLSQLPADEVYPTTEAVWEALGGRREPRRA